MKLNRKTGSGMVFLIALTSFAVLTCKAAGSNGSGDVSGKAIEWTLDTSTRTEEGTVVLKLGFAPAVAGLSAGDFTFEGAGITAPTTLVGSGADRTFYLNEVPETGIVKVSVKKKGFTFDPLSYNWDIAGESTDAVAAAKITFNGNGGRLPGGAASIIVTATDNEVVYPSPEDPFTKPGYGFLGWYETETPAAISAITELYTRPSAGRVESDSPVDSDKTLYAAWGVLPQVEFRDGGTIAVFEYNTLNAVFDDDGTNINYRVPVFHLKNISGGDPTHPVTPLFPGNSAGSTFAKWATEYNGGDELRIGQIITPPSSTTITALYAQWIDLSDTASKGALEDLTDTIQNDLLNAENSLNLYDDEFLVGSGLSLNENVTTFLSELNVLLEQTVALLQGTQHEQAGVELDNGETGTIYWTEYDYAAIAAKYEEITEKKQNPLYALAIENGDISPTMIIIPGTMSGSVHSVTITSRGYYEIDAYGASGGHLYSKNNKTALGGKGGHAKGIVRLEKGTVLKVRVGGEGLGTAAFDSTTSAWSMPSYYSSATSWIGKSTTDASKNVDQFKGAHAGGYNGGGTGAGSANYYAGGAGGGGATDVRLLGTFSDSVGHNRENGVDTSNNGLGATADLNKRILVAAGGGGAAQAADVGGSNWPGIPGGDAGQNGIIRGPINTSGYPYLFSTYCLQVDYDGYCPPHSSSTALVSVVTKTNAKTSGTTLGQGASGQRGSASEGTGGGGGGYYGGESILNNTSLSTDATASGAGGSNYVSASPAFTNTELSGLNDVFGNGKVTIKYVGQ